MRSLAIKFDSEGAEFLLTKEVDGVVATMQKVAVNLVTDKGSGALYPARGTTLRRDANSGSLGNFQRMQHAVNFACSDTQTFIKSHQDSTTPPSEVVNKLQGEITFIGGGSMRIHTTAEDGSGNKISETVDY